MYDHGYGHRYATSSVAAVGWSKGRPCFAVTGELTVGTPAVDGTTPGDDRFDSESSPAEQDDSSPSSADAGRDEVRPTPFRIPSTVNADARRGLAAGGLTRLIGPQSCRCRWWRWLLLWLSSTADWGCARDVGGEDDLAMIAATLNDNIGGLESLTTDGEDRSGRVTGFASNSSGGAKLLLPFPVGTSSTSSAAAVVTRGGDGETVARQRRAESPTLTAGSPPTSLGESMFVTDAFRCWSVELRRLFAMTRSVNRVINLDRRRRRASKTCQNSWPKLSQQTVTQRSLPAICGACVSSCNVCIQTRAPVEGTRRPRLPRRPAHVNQPDWQFPAAHGAESLCHRASGKARSRWSLYVD